MGFKARKGLPLEAAVEQWLDARGEQIEGEDDLRSKGAALVDIVCAWKE